MPRDFGENAIASETKNMALIADYLLQEICKGRYTQKIDWNPREIAQMSCEIYRKLSSS